MTILMQSDSRWVLSSAKYPSSDTADEIAEVEK